MPDERRLPSYRRPPVVEVVASAAFQKLPESAFAHLGAFWQQEASGHYPRLSYHAPYQPQLERFGHDVKRPEFGFAVTNRPPFPRMWMQTRGLDEMLQLQDDWFACNWRKVGPDDDYGRWLSRRSAFADWYGRLSAYLLKSGVPQLHVEQCEVTYVNHVAPNRAWRDHSELHKVLKVVQPPHVLPRALRAEQTSFTQQFVSSPPERPPGRLLLSAQPAYGQDDEPLWVLELTARLRVSKPAPIGEILQTLDEGRQWIVESFHNLTTENIRQEWGEYFDGD